MCHSPNGLWSDFSVSIHDVDSPSTFLKEDILRCEKFSCGNSTDHFYNPATKQCFPRQAASYVCGWFKGREDEVCQHDLVCSDETAIPTCQPPTKQEHCQQCRCGQCVKDEDGSLPAQFRCSEDCIDMLEERDHTCVELEGSISVTMKAKILGHNNPKLDFTLPIVTKSGKDMFCGPCNADHADLVRAGQKDLHYNALYPGAYKVAMRAACQEAHDQWAAYNVSQQSQPNPPIAPPSPPPPTPPQTPPPTPSTAQPPPTLTPAAPSPPPPIDLPEAGPTPAKKQQSSQQIVDSRNAGKRQALGPHQEPTEVFPNTKP